MFNPATTLLDWWKLVKTGGYLFIVVPDEDLYEQGVFPSRFNNDHKATFTLSKSKSWSPVSHNVRDLGLSRPGGQIMSLELQDRDYDRNLMSFGKHKPTLFIRFLAKIYGNLSRRLGDSRLAMLRKMLVPYYPIDQTSDAHDAQAQIQLIVKKTA